MKPSSITISVLAPDVQVLVELVSKSKDMDVGGINGVHSASCTICLSDAGRLVQIGLDGILRVFSLQVLKLSDAFECCFFSCRCS